MGTNTQSHCSFGTPRMDTDESERNDANPPTSPGSIAPPPIQRKIGKTPIYSMMNETHSHKRSTAGFHGQLNSIDIRLVDAQDYGGGVFSGVTGALVGRALQNCLLLYQTNVNKIKSPTDSSSLANLLGLQPPPPKFVIPNPGSKVNPDFLSCFSLQEWWDEGYSSPAHLINLRGVQEHQLPQVLDRIPDTVFQATDCCPVHPSVYG